MAAKMASIWKFAKQTFLGYPDFPPFCFLSHRLNSHTTVIYRFKGIFVLYNIGLAFMYGKMHARGPKTTTKKHSAAMLDFGIL